MALGYPCCGSLITDLHLIGCPEHPPKWVPHAQFLFNHLGMGLTYTGEELRHALHGMGLPEPDHPNTWGAFIMHCKKAGVLAGTGMRTRMIDPRAHGRKTDVLRVQGRWV